MKSPYLQQLIIFSSGFLGIFFAHPSQAQNIVLDGSLGPRLVLTGPVYEIDQGSGVTVNENLFHSFQTFNLDAGETAIFDSSSTIQNIFSRVTGGKRSSIDGTLFTTSEAVNLFLINPNGILFGPNSSLTIGSATRGSFFATTLDGVSWPDGSQFNAVAPADSSGLLNIVGDPSGFIASQRSIQGIEVLGDDFIPGLNVSSGQSLILLGGEIAIADRELRIFFPGGGRVELAGISEAGQVTLNSDQNDWSLEIPDSLTRSDISLNNAFINVVGEGEGSLSIYGHNVDIQESKLSAGVELFSEIEGVQAGELLIDAQATVNIQGNSRVSNDVLMGGEFRGNSGDISIVAQTVEIIDDVQLSSSSFGRGNAGNVQLLARENILLQDSDVFSNVLRNAEGRGGNILLDAPVIELLNNSSIDSSLSGTGSAGNINIRSSERIFFQDSNIFSSVFQTGDGLGGDITIDAAVIQLVDDSSIDSSLRGIGDAGKITVKASEALLLQDSNIFSNVTTSAVGQGGNITIDATVIELAENASIDASLSGQGSTGNITVNASEEIFLQNGRIFNNVLSSGIGNSGDVIVEAPVIELLDGAKLDSSTSGAGNAGTITVKASEALLLQDSNIFSNVTTSAVGQGGDITIDATVIELAENASIDVSLSGQGSTGNITVNASEGIFLQDSRIFSNVLSSAIGNSGEVSVEAPVIEFLDGAKLDSSTSGEGNAGSLKVIASERVLFQGTTPNGGFSSGAFSTVTAGAAGDGGDLLIEAPVIELLDGAKLDSSTSGQGDAGDMNLVASERVLFRGTTPNESFSSSAFSTVELGGVGDGGDVIIETPVLEMFDGSALVASTWGEGDAGNIRIQASERVLFQGRDPSGVFPSTAFIAVEEGAVGQGGNVSIEAPVIELLDGAALVSRTSGEGDAGNVELTAEDNIFLRDSNIFSNVLESGVGQGGGITIDTSVIEFTANSSLDSSLRGQGSSGPITVQASEGVFLRDSNIFSNVLESGVGQGGGITIDTSVIEFTANSSLDSSLRGQGSSGTITVQASEGVFLRDSTIFNNVLSNAVGQGGSISVEAPVIEILDGAQLDSSTSGTGNAGDVKVVASERVLFQGTTPNESLIFRSSGASSTVKSGAVGEGGTVKIEAPIIELLDGAELTSRTSGEGDAGNVQLTAGESILLRDSRIFSDVRDTGIGQGGSILLEAPTVELTVSSSLDSGLFGQGVAGPITIKAAEEVSLRDSSIFSDVLSNAVGQGGKISITSPVIEILDGSTLISNTVGDGNAGQVQVVAGKNFLLDGASEFGRVSEILTSNGRPNGTQGTGTGGEISISSPQLTISNGAIINAQTVNAQSGGDITLTANQLDLLSGAQVFTTSDGDGPAGSISLTANEQIRISGVIPSSIQQLSVPTEPLTTVSVRSNGDGSAGNVILNTSSFTLSDRAQIIAKSSNGTGGSIFIGSKPNRPQFSDLSVIQPNSILLRDNSLISATAGDSQNPGNGGNINITTPFLIGFSGENSDIIANAFSGTGGQINITANSLFNFEAISGQTEVKLRQNTSNDISASSQFGNSGTISLNTLNVNPADSLAELPSDLVDASSLIDQSLCAIDNKSEFLVTGRGGLPTSPSDAFSASLAWEDWNLGELDRNLPTSQSPAPPTASVAKASLIPQTKPLLEAKHWGTAPSGQVVLYASAQAPVQMRSPQCRQLQQQLNEPSP